MLVRRQQYLVIGAILAAGVTCASRAGAQPSTSVATYVLFAGEALRMRTAVIRNGHVGVNDGLLYSRGSVIAPKSDFAADMVHLDPGTDCRDLFTNALTGGAASCAKAPPLVPHPLVASISAACSFPIPFPSCAPARPVLVDHGQTVSLPPGSYGDLVVEGGGAGPATLRLEGDYTFCNVRVSRGSRILFRSASTVRVGGDVRISNKTYTGPDTSIANPPPPGAIKWFVRGSQVRFSRKDVANEYICAPNAKLLIGSGGILTGHFVARAIRLKRATIDFALPFPGVCGDGVISTDEQCEQTADCPASLTCMSCTCMSTTTTTTLPQCMDDEDCNQGSTGGAFVCEDGHCVPACDDDEDCNQGSAGGAFVCEDGHCIPACDDDEDCNQGSAGGALVCVDGHCVPDTNSSTTSTTTIMTIPSSSSTTTTTTTIPCASDDDCPIGRCVEGMCRPECEDDADCNQGSPSGSLVCQDGRCVASGELCGDCIDNDDNGLVDFEDSACCSDGADQLFAMSIKRGKFRPAGTGTSVLRLRGTLARSGLATMIDPPAEDVFLQIRQEGTGEVLCAKIPAGKFAKKRKSFRYSRKKNPAPPELARDLDRFKIKARKKGQVLFSTKGKRVLVTTPPEGAVQIIVGFRRPEGPASANVCSAAVRAFRSGKKGALRFP